MGGKKGGENTKKVAGNAKKAEAAARKDAEVNAKHEAAETKEWNKGAKDNSKKEQEAAKKAEAAAKKAEKDRLLAEEEASQPSKPKGANKKTAEKKSKGTLDSMLGQFDSSQQSTALNASGIDNALDALSLTENGNGMKIDRHPERRYKAAYAKFEATRLPEMKADADFKGLRENQMKERIRKEFEKHEDNPFNQAGIVSHDATREEIEAERERIKTGIENRLGGK